MCVVCVCGVEMGGEVEIDSQVFTTVFSLHHLTVVDEDVKGI